MSLKTSSQDFNQCSLDELAVRARRLCDALSKNDREVFARLMLGMELQPFHLDWLRFQDEHERTVLLAPRGHGKTTIADILFVLWRVLKNPDTRVLVVSNTMLQAKSFLREIAAHIERPEIARLWGNPKGTRWNEGEIELNRKRIAKEPTITAVGAGGAIISRHYELIVCDDIIDEENSATALQRDKARTWFFKTLLPCLEPQGGLHIIGTRWHHADLYGELIKSGWPTRIDRAMDANGSALWPERFSAKSLADMRTAAGERIFNCQYQNDPSGYEGAIFRYSHFKFYEKGTEPCGLKKFAAADLAISQSETADYFAHAVVGIDRDGAIYVLECSRARLSFHQQVEFIMGRAALHKPLRIGIEAVAYQKALAQELSRRSPLPVVELKDSKDKVTRAWRLAAHFETGRVRLPRGAGELEEELLQFPHAPHDDQVDALGYAVEMALQYSQFVVKNF